MSNEKYTGIFPAFYACYDDSGAISPERVRALTEYLIGKGVNGLYVGGSSGECIYQGVEERKVVLENVMAVAKGRVTVIAHVACNNTKDSVELARHAESLGVDAIAAIPPIYFRLPEYSVAQYWNDISSAAPHPDFIIYNIPQLAGISLNEGLLKKMLENPCVKGVKNSSMPTQDIETWRRTGALVFNGPDEQLLPGLAAGAVGGIGGTLPSIGSTSREIWQLPGRSRTPVCGSSKECAPAKAICMPLSRKFCVFRGGLISAVSASRFTHCSRRIWIQSMPVLKPLTP